MTRIAQGEYITVDLFTTQMIVPDVVQLETLAGIANKTDGTGVQSLLAEFYPMWGI